VRLPLIRSAGPVRAAPDERAGVAGVCFLLPVSELLRAAAEEQREDWRHECREARAAFERWSRPREDRAAAFDAYRAALDREQEACRIYRELLAELRRHSP
jgi:acyl-CoA reductase-like NAD-dependent aldehyde dehydrogenase